MTTALAPTPFPPSAAACKYFYATAPGGFQSRERTGCEGRSIPMDRLDQLVASHLEDRLLRPERLETILASVLDRRQERTERRRAHLAETAQADRRNRPTAQPALRRHRVRRRRSRRPRPEGAYRRPQSDSGTGQRRRRAGPGRARPYRQSGCQPRYGQDLRPRGPRAHPVGQWRLPPRPPPRVNPARRGRGQGSPHHGIEIRTAAHAGRRLGRKTRRSRCSEFCSEMAHLSEGKRRTSAPSAVRLPLSCWVIGRPMLRQLLDQGACIGRCIEKQRAGGFCARIRRASEKNLFKR